MVLVTVEAVPAGSKTPADVGVRISKGERHDFGAAAPLSIRGHHPLSKGELEARWSHHQSCWSDTSRRDRPGSQNSYSHASLELQQRPPPCARESSCLMASLSP